MSRYAQFIGIDYSINSPAACICTYNLDFNIATYEFIAGSRGKIKKNRVDLFDPDIGKVHHIELQTKPKQHGMTSQEMARFKIIDAMDVNAKFFTAIKDLVIHKEVYVSIEGFSFGSRGNRLAELAGYNYILRYLLNTFIVNPHNFHVYAPATIKAFAGGGSFKKIDMLNAMINSGDEHFFESPFGKHIKSNWEEYLIIKKSTKVPTDVAKPIDDIVDAYWIVKLLMTTLEFINKVPTDT